MFGSDRTLFAGIAANNWAVSVEPQRDAWKMNPAGGKPHAQFTESAKRSAEVVR
jgi:hypothetical protein